jgi:cytochrome c-type biogenesis protein
MRRGAEKTGQIALIMFLFGIGAALTFAARQSDFAPDPCALARSLADGRQGGKIVSWRGALILFGLLIISGAEKAAQTLVGVSPEWLTNLTTRF